MSIKKKVYYWSPFLSKIATINAVTSSAESLTRYSKDYLPKIINTCGEFNFYSNKIDEIKGKLTAGNIASGIYKTFGQPPEVEESYAGTYGSGSYKAPVVEQYEVAGASTIQNFAQAQPLQVSGYNNIYNPLATPQSSWARTFGQLTT